MCRLYAQVSARPERSRDLLVDSQFALLRQADGDPANPQKDGWGLAWFDPQGRPRVVKSGRSAAEESAPFARAADEAVSTVVLGHLRAASNPHIDLAHAHPFEDEGWVFIHNGTLSISAEVAEALGPRKKRLKTDSDSEIYFQQFLKHLKETRDPSKAFEACIQENWRLWENGKTKEKYQDVQTPYTSLNAIASDGTGIYAVCHASRSGLGKHAIFHGQPWSVMSFATRGGRFVLSSEAEDGGEWTLLSPPETISAVPDGARVKVSRRALALQTPSGPVPEVSQQ